jgi:hypothetical protein
MRSQSKARLVRSGLAVVAILGMTAWAGAQEGGVMGSGNGPGPGAFAGGQMVRGTVTAVAADKITVKTDAGDVYQVALSANTRLMKARQPVKVTDIKAGDGVGAMGVLDALTKTVHAVMVAVVDAEEVKKAKEGLGKVYIMGKVTAIDDVKLTVLRTDGVSQVIEVDEGTSFKRGGRAMGMMMNGGAGATVIGRTGGDAAAGGGAPRAGAGGGGESITLADVKVGDTVAGQGAVKHGVFVPTELGVMDATARRRRPNADGSGPAAGAPAAGTAAPQPQMQ